MRLITKAILLLLAGACIVLARRADANQETAGQARPAGPGISR